MNEQLKQRLIMAALGFNLTIIGYQVVFNSGFFGFQFTILKVILGLAIAAVVGAGAFFAAGMGQK